MGWYTHGYHMIYQEHQDPLKNHLLRLAEMAVLNNRPAVVAASFLTKYPDFLLIGTVQTQFEHSPTVMQQHYDPDIKAWVLDNDPEIPYALYGTNVGGIAVMGALFGDLNLYDQRKDLGVPLTDADRPHYGWEEGTRASSYTYFALPELITMARKLGPELQGYIDVVEWPKSPPDPGVRPLEPEQPALPSTMREPLEAPPLPPGLHRASYGIDTAITYMSIPVNGTDLPINTYPLILPE